VEESYSFVVVLSLQQPLNAGFDLRGDLSAQLRIVELGVGGHQTLAAAGQCSQRQLEMRGESVDDVGSLAVGLPLAEAVPSSGSPEIAAATFNGLRTENASDQPAVHEPLRIKKLRRDEAV
jgi:hypothetical protein